MNAAQYYQHQLTKLGNNVRAMRLKRGITLPKLAALSTVSKGTLSKWENGGLNVSMETVLKVAHALSATPQSLMTGLEIHP